MNANLVRGQTMTLSPTAIALIMVIFTGCVLGVSLGTAAYFANEKNY